ncbi:hypothetical protein [Dactylosporangium darangshiense]|uniref:hypothetical protein n=1 Tax=Dactylosporangium darangshiense TaxID=579108 RepID=UPI0031EF03E5
MSEIDGLTNAEYLVLGPLEADAPRPLWEIAEAFLGGVVGERPTLERIAELLGAALASLAAHGLIEVRRFDIWPAPWDQGSPVANEHLVSESQRSDVWSRSMTHDALAAVITEVGIRWL